MRAWKPACDNRQVIKFRPSNTRYIYTCCASGKIDITIPSEVEGGRMAESKRQKREAQGDTDKGRRKILRRRRYWRRRVVEPPESEASGYENSTGPDEESDRSPPSNSDNPAPLFRAEIDNERRNARAARAGKASSMFLRSTPFPLHRQAGTPRAPTKRRRRRARAELERHGGLHEASKAPRPACTLVGGGTALPRERS